MEILTFSRCTTDITLREQRLAFQQSNPEHKEAPVAPPLSPQEMTKEKLKKMNNPNVKEEAEVALLKFRANQALKTAISDNTFRDKEFEKVAKNRTYEISMEAGRKCKVSVVEGDRRYLSKAEIDLNELDKSIDAVKLSEIIEDIVKDKLLTKHFVEVKK